MKVEFHDLRHEKWFVEAAEETTIAELKTRNAGERQLDEGSNQKLIFSGKILKDTDTLAGIKYAEGKGFIVCMVSKSRKPTPTPKKAPATPAPAAASSSGAPAAAEPAASAPEPAAESTGASAEPEAITGPSAFATGGNLQTVVNNIVEMGYSQPQVLLAMRRAFNNPDRAVEYLVSGEIPEIPEAETALSDDAATTAEGSPAAAAPAAAPEDSQRDVSSIDRNLFDAAEHEEPRGPDFQQMLGLSDEQLEQLRAAVQRDPSSVMRIIEPVVRTHPELAHLLSVHLDDFVRFLHNVDDIDEDEDDEEMAALAGGRQVTIEITPEEDAAITRLMELGFDRQVVATAFIICDKDEQLTANYLLEHGADE